MCFLQQVRTKTLCWTGPGLLQASDNLLPPQMWSSPRICSWSDTGQESKLNIFGFAPIFHELKISNCFYEHKRHGGFSRTWSKTWISELLWTNNVLLVIKNSCYSSQQVKKEHVKRYFELNRTTEKLKKYSSSWAALKPSATGDQKNSLQLQVY